MEPLEPLLSDTLRVGHFEIPRHRRVILIHKSTSAFVDALVQRVEGEGETAVLVFETRSNVGTRRSIQIKVEDLIGVEYET